MLKGIFLEVKNKFETALGVLRKEKITIDPDGSAALQQYANVMKTVGEKYVSTFYLDTVYFSYFDLGSCSCFMYCFLLYIFL